MTPGGDGGCNTLVGVDALRDPIGRERRRPGPAFPLGPDRAVRTFAGTVGEPRARAARRRLVCSPPGLVSVHKAGLWGLLSTAHDRPRGPRMNWLRRFRAMASTAFSTCSTTRIEDRPGARTHCFDLRDPDTDYVFVMNPDVYLCPDVLCELLVPFSSPEVGIVEARQLPLEHPKHFDSADGSTSWASGACMMVRSEVLDVVHGFDADSFFLYCDDVDFSWRTRLAGYRVVFRPPARVYHDKRLRPTAGSSSVRWNGSIRPRRASSWPGSIRDRIWSSRGPRSWRQRGNPNISRRWRPSASVKGRADCQLPSTRRGG